MLLLLWWLGCLFCPCCLGMDNVAGIEEEDGVRDLWFIVTFVTDDASLLPVTAISGLKEKLLPFKSCDGMFARMFLLMHRNVICISMRNAMTIRFVFGAQGCRMDSCICIAKLRFGLMSSCLLSPSILLDVCSKERSPAT